MKIEFDVKMTASALYDYMLRHAYASMSGLLGTIAGALLVVAYFMMEGGILYLLAGLVILLYLPWTLFVRSRKQILANPAFKEVLHYQLDEEGITVSQKEVTETIPWEAMQKAISTGKSIIVYTSKVNAFIFPRKDMGALTIAVIEYIFIHMAPEKVHIKY